MANKFYNKNTLEAVTQGKVNGDPARSLHPFRLAKTILFFILLYVNNVFCNDIMNEFHSSIDQFNKNGIIHIKYSRQAPETAKEAEVRYEREQDEIRDVAMNKAEIRDQRYWVNGGWICKTNNYKPAKTQSDLVDSDGDGYDDYTEFQHGTSPNDPNIFPAIREGNNKIIFK